MAQLVLRVALVGSSSRLLAKGRKMTQAVILAGGKGTRLVSILYGKPKCLVDIDGTPLLQRQVETLAECGIDEILLLVNHAADQVAEFIEAKKSFGVRITLLDDGEPRGTAGAVIGAFAHLAERFLVVYGDTLINVDLRRLLATHQASNADVTLFLHPNNHPADSDLVEIDNEGWVRRFHPYPHDPRKFYPNLVNAALFAVEKAALERWRSFHAPVDFGKNLFPAMLSTGSKIKGYVSSEYIKDVGTPKRVAEAVKQLRAGCVGRASLTTKQKAVFWDRDGTLIKSRGFITHPDQVELMPDAGESLRRLNGAEFRNVLVTNQPVIARGECTFEGLGEIHAKLETCLGAHGAYLDRIYFCPHHPDRGFSGEIRELKVVCSCRKPATGMIEAAVRDLNIDLGRSWMIGDTWRDIDTANAIGMRSILLLGSEGSSESGGISAPTLVANSLSEVVDHILGREDL